MNSRVRNILDNIATVLILFPAVVCMGMLICLIVWMWVYFWNTELLFFRILDVLLVMFLTGIGISKALER